LVAGFLSLYGCSDIEKKPGEQSTEKIPDSIIESANIVLTSEGKKEAVINARKLVVFDQEDSTLATEVKVDFYDESGDYRSTLTSDEGLVRQKRQELTVWGNVVVASDSSRLLTESLSWDPGRKLIVTDDYVELHRGDDVITGYGMEADNRLEDVRILRDVKGRISDIPQSEEELDSLEKPETREIRP
jgi:LPS export ABC transporter protein LptC